MFAICNSCFRVTLLFALLILTSRAAAQQDDFNVEKWFEILCRKDFSKYDSLESLFEQEKKPDSAKIFQFLDQLEEKGKSKGTRYRVLLNDLRARFMTFNSSYYDYYENRNIYVNQSLTKEEVIKLLTEAMDMAYRLEDEMLVAYTSWSYGACMNWYGETGLLIMHTKNAIDLFEKQGYPIKPYQYQFLAEKLYSVREYDECIKYAKKAVNAWQQSPNEFKPFTVSCINTVGLGFHRQKIFDSALVYYNRALDLAKQIDHAVWKGIVSGNMGQLFYAQGMYDTAYSLFMFDYTASKENKYFDNAANSLQWAARANLAMGYKDAALSQSREAIQLLALWPDAGYLRNTFYTTSLIFKELRNYDSAFYYNNLYSVLNDSLEKVVATNSLAITKARISNEENRYNIQKLNREKKAQLQFRNFIIAFIVLASIIALLYVNRLRIRSRHKAQLALQEKNAAEAMAREQLQLITQNLMEKTSLAEELQRQLNNKTVSAERQELASTISNLTILTESDWEKFKSLFEQLYPGFFMNLREKVNDITVAELRMAALTRLRLSAHEIASILGISSNSVYKTKQRLRQRLHVEADSNIEDIIASI